MFKDNRPVCLWSNIWVCVSKMKRTSTLIKEMCKPIICDELWKPQADSFTEVPAYFWNMAWLLRTTTKKFQELIYSRPKSGFISLKTQSSTVNLRLDTRSVLLKERWHVQVPLQKRHHLKCNTSKNDSLIVLLQSVITVRVKVGKTPRVEDPEIQNTGLGLHQLCDITVMSHRDCCVVGRCEK